MAAAHLDQRSLWPSTVTFSPAMYDSLKKHALPLNTRVVTGLPDYSVLW